MNLSAVFWPLHNCSGKVFCVIKIVIGTTMKNQSYLIIGCGHFGRQAVEKLLKRNPQSQIIAVDKNRRAVQQVSHLPIETIVSDGIQYLNRFLSEGRQVDYIIPAVPFHVAFEFILSRSKPLGARKKEIPHLHGLPNPIMGRTGDLYTSFADFLCPEDCPEPPQYCTATGKRREKPLCKMLMDLGGPFESMVIRSQQLGLGVGGFQPKALLGLLEEVKESIASSRVILISTACRCHGVTSALSFTKPSRST